MRRATQTDIAKALGLSPSTVGLVVGNNKSPLRRHLNKDTVRRIEEKAKELGYQPNRAAQVMRGSRTNLIIFLNMGSQSEWIHRQVYHVGMIAHQLGYDFQVIDAYWWVSKGNRAIDQVISMRPEGVIVSGAPQADEMDFSRFEKAGIPIVSLDFKLPRVACVRHGVEGAIFELASACIAAGRKRLALVVRKEAKELWQTTDRRKGFTRALVEAGRPKPKREDIACLKPEQLGECDLIIDATAPLGYFSPFQPGHLVAEKIGTAFDACIFANDPYAFGGLSHFLRNGIRVPDQVAISGFDNSTYTTEGSVPLTTVEFPAETMCKKAMELLMGQIDGPRLGEEDHIYPCKILWRESMPKPKTSRSSSMERNA